MAVIKNDFFVLKFPTSFQNYQQIFLSHLEIDLGIYKRLQNYKSYPQVTVQSSDIRVNNQYL